MATDARGNRILSYGFTGGDVSWLKGIMNWWGYYDSSHPDSALGAENYGWDLANAVAKFQSDYGLSGSGATDSDTWYAIELASAGYNPDQVRSMLRGETPTTAPAPTGPTPAPVDTNPETNPLQRSAMARLQQVLNQYNLGGMTQWIKDALIAGKSEAEIQLELYDQPEFKQRFPAIEARRQAGLTPVSPAEILEYEQRGREIFRAAGLTSESLTDSSYLQGLMTQDISLAEVQGRINDGFLRVQMAPPEVKNMFGQFFGTSGDQALAQFFLDPEKAAPELERMATTAIVGGIGERYQMQISQQLAREVADTGVSDAAIWQGFQRLDTMKAIFEESISETQDLQAEQQGIGAVFGTQPGMTDTLERRVASRTSQFRGGGGSMTSDRGALGLGVADS